MSNMMLRSLLLVAVLASLSLLVVSANQHRADNALEAGVEQWMESEQQAVNKTVKLVKPTILPAAQFAREFTRLDAERNARLHKAKQPRKGVEADLKTKAARKPAVAPIAPSPAFNISAVPKVGSAAPARTGTIEFFDKNDNLCRPSSSKSKKSFSKYQCTQFGGFIGRANMWAVDCKTGFVSMWINKCSGDAEAQAYIPPGQNGACRSMRLWNGIGANGKTQWMGPVVANVKVNCP
jgi:hypothetical protein